VVALLIHLFELSPNFADKVLDERVDAIAAFEADVLELEGRQQKFSEA
jgi:hypothetical protein